MPTFSTAELETLLEPRVRDYFRKSLNFDQISTPAWNIEAPTAVKPPVAARHIYISPALYTTPEPAPLPEDFSVPLSPSPYVVNRKRRGGGAGPVGNRGDGGAEVVPTADIVEEEVESVLSGMLNDQFEGNGAHGDVEVEGEGEGEEETGEEFCNSKCESMSVGSANGSVRQFDCRSFLSAQGEYFDAVEDFFSDSSLHSTSLYSQSVESDLRALRLSLLEEIGRRNNAEEALKLLQSCWLKFRNLLYEAKLTYHIPSSGGVMPCEDAAMEDLAQEVIVGKFVTEEIGKALARAEAELEAEVVLESKDQEISRLRDKLVYYEAVNHEMSQRNQEIIEHARKQRQRKKSRRRWFWSFIGLTIAAGISVVGYSYLPRSVEHQELLNDLSDGSGISSSKAA